MGAGTTENEKNPDRENMILVVSTFLILLAFFIMLSSVAITDLKKQEAALKSLSASFGGGARDRAKNPDKENKYPGESEKGDFTGLLSGSGEPVTGNINFKTGKDIQMLVIGESDLYMPDSHFIKPSSLPLLKKLGDYIGSGRFKLEIAGHTDGRDPEEKGYRSNHELSTLMALQIQRYLIEESGVDPERITAYGSGSGRPETSNETFESRIKNRRIEIIIKGKEAAGLRRMYVEPHRGTFSYRGFNFRIFE
jgi:chemotaxis protein MotB